MPTLAPALSISEPLINSAISRAVQNVCQTMLRENARLVSRIEQPLSNEAFSEFRVLGSIGFIGATNGIFYLCMTDDFAAWATGQILGMSPAEVEAHGPDVLKDAMGEITNMTAGGFKNELSDHGFPCKLTLPTIVRGRHIGVAAIKSAMRFIFEFDCGGHRLIVDTQLQPD